MGSISAWQEAHAGFCLCCASTALTEEPGGKVSMTDVSTPCGGGGTVLHRSCSATNLPRRVGEVRCGGARASASQQEGSRDETHPPPPGERHRSSPVRCSRTRPASRTATDSLP